KRFAILLQPVDGAVSGAKGKALFGDCANGCKCAKGVKQIEQARIGGAKLAFERVRRSLEKLGYLSRILKLPRGENDKANLVLTAAPGAAGHLLQLACLERAPAFVAPNVCIADDDRPGRKIDTRSNRRRRKNRI